MVKAYVEQTLKDIEDTGDKDDDNVHYYEYRQIRIQTWKDQYEAAIEALTKHLPLHVVTAKQIPNTFAERGYIQFKKFNFYEVLKLA